MDEMKIYVEEWIALGCQGYSPNYIFFSLAQNQICLLVGWLVSPFIA